MRSAEQATKQITVNGKALELNSESTLSALLNQLEINSTEGLALGVNGSVVSKGNWDTTTLKQGDAVLLVRAARGG